MRPYDCPLETLYLGRNLNYESQKCGLSPFYRKEELLSLTIGSKVTIIGSHAFSYCSAITNVTIPNSVTEILEGAFYDCTALKELYIEDGYTTLELGNNITFDSSLETLYLGRNLNYNYSYANAEFPPFYNHTELKSLIIGNCVSTIGNYLFCGCSAITSVIIPNSVKIIGAFAFEDCSAITNVTIPDSVTEILNGAFSGCSKLTNITIPNSVISISDKAFSDCIALKELYIEDGNTILHLGVNFWHSTSNGEGLFYDCPLETLYLGRDLEYNDEYRSGYSPFSYKRKLTSLTISTGVTSVGKNAFYECDGIDSIYLMGAVPASVCDNNFTESQFVTTRVYVPKGTLEIYQATDVWKNFWNIQEHSLIEYHTVTYRVDGEIYETQLVALGDTIPTIDEPAKEGHTFSGWSEIPETMPAHDVTVTGSFSINSYDLVYMIDGEEYKQVTLEFGSEIVPEEEPTKEGYTFSGWSEIPETMPAQDVEVTGSFSINSYDLVYMIDGEEYKRVTLEFGSEIIPEEEPEKEGYTFSGWSEIPETMPAEDVTVTGSFSINSYDLVYMVDNEEYKRVTLEFGSEIVPEEEPTKEGYTFSGWSEIPETMPAHDVEVTGSFIPTNVSEITAEVSLQINGNNISLSNANNSTVAIYSINGVLVKKIDKYTGEEIALEKGVYIVCVGDKAMKIKL